MWIDKLFGDAAGVSMRTQVGAYAWHAERDLADAAAAIPTIKAA